MSPGQGGGRAKDFDDQKQAYPGGTYVLILRITNRPILSNQPFLPILPKRPICLTGPSCPIGQSCPTGLSCLSDQDDQPVVYLLSGVTSFWHIILYAWSRCVQFYLNHYSRRSNIWHFHLVYINWPYKQAILLTISVPFGTSQTLTI